MECVSKNAMCMSTMEKGVAPMDTLILPWLTVLGQVLAFLSAKLSAPALVQDALVSVWKAILA